MQRLVFTEDEIVLVLGVLSLELTGQVVHKANAGKWSQVTQAHIRARGCPAGSGFRAALRGCISPLLHPLHSHCALAERKLGLPNQGLDLKKTSDSPCPGPTSLQRLASVPSPTGILPSFLPLAGISSTSELL